MANLASTFAGIRSPNPFWLASAPPTDKEYNVRRAFEAGWGGVVWKTLGLDPHIVNVNGPRYGAIWGADRRLLGLNNIELITDRPLQVNLDEIAGLDFYYYPGVIFETAAPGITVSTDAWFYGIGACQSSPLIASIVVGDDVAPGTVVTITARVAMLKQDCPDTYAIEVPITVH